MDEGHAGVAAKDFFASSLNHNIIQVGSDLRKTLIELSLSKAHCC